MSITHAKVVTVPDDGTSPVGTDEWNAAHVVDLTAADVVVSPSVAGQTNVQDALEAVGGLPPQWTDGGHGDVTATTDAGVSAGPVLILKANAGQTGETESANLLEWQDHDGNVYGHFDYDGGALFGVDIRVKPVGGGAAGVDMTAAGQMYIHSDDGDPLTITNVAGTTTPLRVRVAQESGPTLVTMGRAQSQIGLYIDSSGTVENPADALQVISAETGNNAFRVLGGGAVVTAQHVAPADGDLANGEMATWFDQTNGAAKLMIKAKTADGTVVAGEVALT